jgi:hypothetical protein
MFKNFRIQHVTLALLLFMVPIWPGQALASPGPVTLPQGLSPIAQSGQDLGRLLGNMPIQLAVILSLRNEKTLQNLIAAQNTPGSPQYHHFLTPEQFVESYSPTTQDYQAVVDFLQNNGLRIQTTTNRQLVMADGSASQAEKAFSTELHVFNYRGKSHYANVTRPPVFRLIWPALSRACRGWIRRSCNPPLNPVPT